MCILRRVGGELWSQKVTLSGLNTTTVYWRTHRHVKPWCKASISQAALLTCGGRCGAGGGGWGVGAGCGGKAGKVSAELGIASVCQGSL